MNKKTIRPLARLAGYYLWRTKFQAFANYSADRKQDYVFQHLKKTLVRAYEGVPLYRKRFKETSFDPNVDFRQLSDLARLPLLSKHDVRSSPDDVIDRRFDKDSVTASTSGTTGEPMTMRLNFGYIAFDYACIFRFWGQAGYRFRDPFVALRSYVPSAEGASLWNYSRAQNTLYMSAYHLSPKTCESYLEAIRKFRPQYIRGYPSSVNMLAEYAAKYADDFRQVRGIFTASATLLPSERANIERVFGKKLYDWYGMTEPVAVITETLDHSFMSVNWEYGYCEFVESPDLGSDEYKLVATGFHNPVMPFIRYDTGDVVKLCPGERPESFLRGGDYPKVAKVLGKKDECLIMADGRRLPSLNFDTLFREQKEVMQFQLIQYGRAEVAARISLRPETQQVDLLMKELRHKLLMRLGSEVDLSIQITDSFITSGDGKPIPVLRRPGSRAVEEIKAYASSTQAAWRLEREGAVINKLDYNEADARCSSQVREALVKAIQNDRYIYWYPESQTHELLELLSGYTGISKELILPVHGSDMAIELVATAFSRPGDKILTTHPTYEKFQYMVEERGAKVELFEYYGNQPFPVDDFIAKLTASCPRIVYFSNPNNPIGYCLDEREIQKIILACEKIAAVLFLDEAYYEFSKITGMSFLKESPHLVISRTFSKAFGLAGLRLGYLVANAPLMDVLKRINNTNHTTMLAKLAGIAALKDLGHTLRYVDEVEHSKQRVYDYLKSHQIAYVPSFGNYILIKHPRSTELSKFLHDNNIFVREKTKTFSEGCFRVTIGGKEGTDALLECMERFFNAPQPSV